MKNFDYKKNILLDNFLNIHIKNPFLLTEIINFQDFFLIKKID